jgi:tol-pal system-associated acyl-CoA thioesterase
MSSTQHHFPVQVYYEDTDHSGVVYYANYLKYFERAREHVVGTDEIVRLWNEEGMGFSVYKVKMRFFDGACFGDQLDIRTTVEKDGDYRVVFSQEVWRPNGKKPAVTAVIEMVCLDKNRRLKPIPSMAID